MCGIHSDYSVTPPQLTNITPLVDANSAARDTHPVWSADGQSIIFESNRDGITTSLYEYVLPSAPAGASNQMQSMSLQMQQESSGVSQIVQQGSSANEVRNCLVLLKDYTTLYLYESLEAALEVDNLVQHALQDNIITRQELDRIIEFSNLFTRLGSLETYLLGEHIPPILSEPYGLITLDAFDNQQSSTVGHIHELDYWISTRYGIVHGCSQIGEDTADIDTTTFSFTSMVDITNLYTMELNTGYSDGNTIRIHPLDTSLELGLLSSFVVNSDEFQMELRQCSDGGGSFPNLTVCGQRIYNRFLLQANNRFNLTIYNSAIQHNIPPLFLKILLMQESGLVPSLTPNGSSALGIAQFTPIAVADMIQSRDQVISVGEYLSLIDGLRGHSPYTLSGYTITANPSDPCYDSSNLLDSPIPSVQYPSSESNCVAFDEVLGAVDAAAFFIEDIVNRYLLTSEVTQTSSWSLTPETTKQEIIWLMAAAGFNWGPPRAGYILAEVAKNSGNQPLNIDLLCPQIDSEQALQYIRNIRLGIPGASPTNMCN